MTTSPNSLAAAWVSSPVGRIAAPLREQVIQALRTAILDYRLKPGQRLVERELIEQLGVSRTTVREALRELTSEGLVTVVPQKGAIVSAPSPDEARDLYEARAALESVVVKRFLERASKSQVMRLSAAAEGFAEATESEDPLPVLAAWDEFYDILTEGAGSDVLKQLTEGLQARVRVLRVVGMSPEGHAAAVAGVRGIATAIAEGDAEGAAHLYQQYILQAGKNALKSLLEVENS